VNLKSIEGLDYIRQDDAGLRVGALTTLTDVLDHGAVSQDYPVLHQAVSVIASPQIRNMATLAGNILQRPRCWYYRSEDFPCLKKGGARCYAVGGVNTYHAIFGSGPSYIVHPSDAAPALMALGATVNIHGPRGANEVVLDDFFTMPEMNIRRENILRPNEIVTEITIPKPEANSKGMFLKVRERESIDFALVSLAAQMTVVNGTCERASLVLGGVAPIPWRAVEAEDYLRGRRITEARAESAAEAAVEDAAPMPHNGYKVEIAKNLVKQAVQALAA
ncbi:MAG: xanthine dehydrogenase family protein subunit M, partial [Gemmatimonadetes bacterium]|nr:xanthine dehydrogenase family protein subunit M [Gemmatimonadota bacterium]